jgi:hypothetical protein
VRSILRLNDLYGAAANVTGGRPVELVAVADVGSARLAAAVRDLMQAVADDDPADWGDLLAMARQLRWRLATEPFPASYGGDRQDLVRGVQETARRRKLMSGPDTQHILEGLADYAADSGTIPPVGEALLRSLADGDADSDCAVIVVGARAADGTKRWFHEIGLSVPVATGRQAVTLDVREHAYFLGGPPLFGASAVTAARAWKLSYLFPSWIGDRTIPLTRFSDYAEGAIRVRKVERKVGPAMPAFPVKDEIDDPLIPQPVWIPPRAAQAPADDEVLARRVLLGGGLAIMLDRGGEHIRTLDPQQPAGERVELRDVSAVAPGTYLVLREGETESAALYARALSHLGGEAEAVKSSQNEWKSLLRSRLNARGRPAVVGELRRLGVRAAGQAPAWTRTTVARPQAGADFDLLLGWLGLRPEQYRDQANRLRRARAQAMADVRESLEDALSVADMDKLQRDGHLRLVLGIEGFAGIIAAQVLAVSPHEVPVPAHELRFPVQDRAARWLA